MPLLASAEGVAAITAGATLIGAAGLASVTMYTTLRRFREESKRQAASLSHERELTDLADLRVLVDEAALVLDQTRADTHLRDLDLALAVLASEGDGTLGDLIATLKTREEAARELLVRLTVRLGRDDPIAGAFSRAVDALRMMLASAEAVEFKLTSDQGSEPFDFREAADGFDSDASEFMETAVVRIGVVIG